MDKAEIKNWIEFLYNDLKQHHVKIGGFNFKFEQLNEFLNKKSLLERKITRANNQRKITEQLQGKNLSMDLSDTLDLKIKSFKQEADLVSTKIKAINKFNETIELPVTYEELNHVCEQLAYCLDEVEFFQLFLLDELNTIKDNDLSCFYVYINDILSDVKDTINGKIIVKKIKISAQKAQV